MDFWRARPPLVYGMWLSESYIHRDELDAELRALLEDLWANEDVRGFLKSHKNMRRTFQQGPKMLDGRKWDDWLQNLSEQLTYLCIQHHIPLSVQGILWRWIWAPMRATVFDVVPTDFVRDGLVGLEKFRNPKDGYLPSAHVAWDRTYTPMLVIRIDAHASVREIEKAVASARAALMGRAEEWPKRGGKKQEEVYILADDLCDYVRDGVQPPFVKAASRWAKIKRSWLVYLRQKTVSDVVAQYIVDAFKDKNPAAAPPTVSTVRATLRKDKYHYPLRGRLVSFDDESIA